MSHNAKAANNVKLALEAYIDNMGVEETETPENKVWHFLTGLIEYCDVNAVDFDDELSQVRQYFIETQPLTEQNR